VQIPGVGISAGELHGATVLGSQSEQQNLATETDVEPGKYVPRTRAEPERSVRLRPRVSVKLPATRMGWPEIDQRSLLRRIRRPP
jgi:hypothetical protein